MTAATDASSATTIRPGHRGRSPRSPSMSSYAARTLGSWPAGEGYLARSLRAQGASVFASDIHDYGRGQDAVFDFLSPGLPAGLPPCDLLASNPAFGIQGRKAVASIQHGLQRLPVGGTLALLLPCDFDSGGSRAPLFAGCPYFAGKIVLTRRIKWFEHPTKPNMSPEGKQRLVSVATRKATIIISGSALRADRVP